MRRSFIYLLLMFIINLSLYAQTEITGVINDYTKVTEIITSSQTIIVNNADNFDVGDDILLIQMKGAEIDESNTADFGTILNYKNAGNFELNQIDEVNNHTIKMSQEISHEYDTEGFVQIVKIPRYNDATVIGQLRAKVWNGTTGGVIALIVEGTLTLNSDINASGSGFRGGQTYNSIWECDQMEYFYPHNSWQSSEKGEGITDLPPHKLFGRGAAANGGGGGNSTNAGGAGGGNYGLGGKGGRQYFDGVGCDSIETGGMSGRQLDYSNCKIKLFLGGGGGAGHENDNAASDGGNGGGIILIKANNIESNGKMIISEGVSAEESGNDAAGGGGAGGTIMLDIDDYGNSELIVSVNGGNGGNCNVGPFVHCYGTGGGGGAGTIILLSEGTPLNVKFEREGGDTGIITNPTSPCYMSNYGATKGGEGGILFRTNRSLPFEINISIPDTVADLGVDNINIPIYLSLNAHDLPLHIEEIKINLHFDRKSFYFEKLSTGSCLEKSNNDISFLEIKLNDLVISSTLQLLTELSGTPLLSKENFTPIIIDSIINNDKVLADCLDFVIENGSLTNLGCIPFPYEIRLIDENNLSISPNPVSKELKLNIKSNEKGIFIYEIYNIAWQLIKKEKWRSNFNRKTNCTDLKVIVANMNPGLFFVVLKTPREVLTDTFIKIE